MRALLLFLLAGTGSAFGVRRAEYYGFVLITYEGADGRALALYVSGPAFYCEGPQTILPELRRKAEHEEAFKGGNGYWTRPHNTAKRVVDFHGGHGTRQQAERNIAYWVGLGANRFRSELESPRYWLPSDCKALER